MKKLDRELGLFAVFSISSGAMIGSGIFVLPGLAATIGGPAIFMAYLVAGLLVVPAALSKAEMSTAMPESGGTYVFLDRSLGPLAGNLTGLGTWFSLLLKSAFALVGLSAYLMLFTKLSASTANYVAVGIALFLIVTNCLGAKISGQVQSLLVLITLIVLMVFVGRGSMFIEKSHFVDLFPHGLSGFLTSAAFIFVSYAGVTKIASTAEEIKEPGRNIPWGIMLSLITMMIVYTLVTYVIVGVVPLGELGHGASKLTPVATAGKYLMGYPGQVIMGVIAVLALSSMANAGLMSSSRYPLAMSRDNHLPQFFDQIHNRFGTPVNAIVITGAVLIAFILLLPVKELAKLASAFQLLVFSLVNIALIVFRESEIEWYSPSFRSPGYPYLQILGVAGSLGLLVFMGMYDVYPLVGSILLIGGCLVWYFSYARSRMDRTGALFRTSEEEDQEDLFQKARSPAPVERDSVIVPFFGLEDADMLHVERRIRLAASLCESGEQLDVVDFVEVPEQSFLSGFEAEPEVFEELEERARLLRNNISNEIHVDQVITHNSRGALRNYAEEENPHWVVFDWQRPSKWRALIGGSKWWLEEFPCDTMFFQDKGRLAFKDILVLTEPGPYDGEVVYAAAHLARYGDGRVTFVNPFRADDPENRDSVSTYQAKLNEFCDAPSSSEVIPTTEWVDSIVEMTEKVDLLLMGGLSNGGLADFPGKKRSEAIADQSDCSVARVKSDLENPTSVTKS